MDSLFGGLGRENSHHVEGPHCQESHVYVVSHAEDGPEAVHGAVRCQGFCRGKTWVRNRTREIGDLCSFKVILH